MHTATDPDLVTRTPRNRKERRTLAAMHPLAEGQRVPPERLVDLALEHDGLEARQTDRHVSGRHPTAATH